MWKLAAVRAYAILTPSHGGAQQKESAFRVLYERRVDNQSPPCLTYTRGQAMVNCPNRMSSRRM